MLFGMVLCYTIYNEASRNHSYWKERSAEKKGVALWQGKTIKVEIFIQVNHSAMTESILPLYGHKEWQTPDDLCR